MCVCVCVCVCGGESGGEEVAGMCTATRTLVYMYDDSVVDRGECC